VVAPPARVLERVDGDDDPVEVGERVPTGGDALLNALDALGVEADKREGAAAPQLVLHLVEDVPGHHRQHTVGPAAALQLHEEHADLDGLAQAHSVGHEQPRLELGGGEAEGFALEGQVVSQHLVADGEVCVRYGHRGATDEAVEHEAGLYATWGGVKPEAGTGGVFGVDAIKIREEGGCLVADELVAPDASDDGLRAHRVAFDLQHLPRLVTDDDP
jgi:hypothetical protein